MRNRYMLLADASLIPLAVFVAFTLRFDLRFYEARHEFNSYVLAALIIKPVIFYAFGMYRRYWRYASVRDLMAVLIASGVSLAAMGVFVAVMMVYDPLL